MRNSYGDEYMKDFKTTISAHLNRAKPSEKIKEVVDDMVDAVAGQDPKVRGGVGKEGGREGVGVRREKVGRERGG